MSPRRNASKIAAPFANPRFLIANRNPVTAPAWSEASASGDFLGLASGERGDHLKLAHQGRGGGVGRGLGGGVPLGVGEGLGVNVGVGVDVGVVVAVAVAVGVEVAVAVGVGVGV